MKKIYFILVFSFFSILIFRCQKNIDVKIQNYDSQPVIECILYPGTIPKLFLSNSVAFFSDQATPQQLFVRGASVTIIGPSGSDILVVDSSFDNFRCRWVLFYKGNFPSVVGGTYSLTVNYNNKIYSATTTINQPQVQIQSASYVYSFHDIYGDHEGVVVNYNDATGSGNHYRYQMGRIIDSTVYGASNLGVVHSSCIGNGDFYIRELGRSVYSDKNLDGQQLTLTVEPAFTHQQDDTGFVFIQSIDASSAEFYDQLDKQKLALFNPFIEPVFIKPQIEGAIGVFGSAILSDSVMFVFPE